MLETRSEGVPKHSDFKIVEEDLPQLKDGGRSNYDQIQAWSIFKTMTTVLHFSSSYCGFFMF